MKVLRCKELKLYLPPLIEGGKICTINPYIPHSAEPEHQCILEIEEVDMSEEEYAMFQREGMQINE